MSKIDRERRRQLERRVLLALALAGFAAAAMSAWVVLVPSVARLALTLVTSRSQPVAAVPAPQSRPVYPYSIIRGGAYSAAELKTALDRDAVAARHYSVFRTYLVHTVQSPFTQPVYLSYRIGSAVYWTSRAVQLPKGDTLLTDGKNYARARCGNRISEKPQTPMNETEPEARTLDTPQPLVPAAGLDIWPDNRIFTTPTPPYAQLAPAPGLPVPVEVAGLPTPVPVTPPCGFRRRRAEGSRL